MPKHFLHQGTNTLISINVCIDGLLITCYYTEWVYQTPKHVYFVKTVQKRLNMFTLGVRTLEISGNPGGGTQVQRGVAVALRISRKKGSFFKTSACPRFCKRRVLFCTQVRSMGVKIPLQSTKYTRL